MPALQQGGFLSWAQAGWERSLCSAWEQRCFCPAGAAWSNVAKPSTPITAAVMTAAKAFPSCSRRGGPREAQLPPGQHGEHRAAAKQETLFQEKLGESLKSTSLRQRHGVSTPEHYTCPSLSSWHHWMKAEKLNWQSPTCLHWFQVKWRVDTFTNVFHREHSSFWSFLGLRFCNYGGFNLKRLKVNREIVFLDRGLV